MDSIERDLRTYGGTIAAARARAHGIRELDKTKDLKVQLSARGIDDSDAKHLEEAATTLESDVAQMRQIWAQLQQLAGHLHTEVAALADDVRSVDDAARAALGRKSEHLPALGIKPVGRKVHRAKEVTEGEADDSTKK